jgi:uncharacterized protein (DUF433 family)
LFKRLEGRFLSRKAISKKKMPHASVPAVAHWSGSDGERLCGKFVAREKAMGWIVSDADHLGGKPRVRDTRISVALLLEWLAAGMTIGEIVKEYPSLTEEAVRGTLEELAHSDMLAASENSPR